MRQVRGRPLTMRTRLNGRQCAYCGSTATTMDHFPPVESTIQGFLLPSCKECNQIASTRHPYNFELRAKHVKMRLRQRYNSLLKSPDWADDEIDDTGRGIQTWLKLSQQARKDARERIAWDATTYVMTIGKPHDFHTIIEPDAPKPEPDFYGEIIEPPKIMCGCCKATGIAHEWTKEGDLRPTKTRKPCKECNGSGWAKSQ